ncbi:nuclear envelope pore membrane protein POM 121-like [Oryctolagus cuniculus]|uniref:nuclear envelope pore membrane protein POM 121-like n=1 Tax=Oryctolagus cuniculus TaxID=9986 RepID=UPI003879A620
MWGLSELAAKGSLPARLPSTLDPCRRILNSPSHAPWAITWAFPVHPSLSPRRRARTSGRRLTATHPAAPRCRRPPGHQVPRGDPSPGCQPSGRPAQRHGQTSFSRFGIAPRRRYPIQQPRYSRVGDGEGTPLDRRLTRRPGPGQIISSTQPSQSAKALDPCAPQSGAAALPERKRRRSPAGEAQILLAGRETKGGCPAGPGQGQSAVWAPLTGPQDSDAHLSKRPRHSCESSPESSTTAGIPVPVRNAISSSYSSTGGLLRPRKPGRPTSSAFCGPAASCSKIPERPAKVTGEEALGPRSSTSPPLVTDRESQRRRAVGAAAEKPGLRNSPPTPGGSWPHKRKFAEQLSGGGDLGTLPPAPRLGYPVTLEDGDMATKGSSRWLNQFVEHRMDAAQESAPESPPRTQPPSALPLPAASTAPSSAAFWGRIKRQTAPRFPAFPEYAGVAATVAPLPAKIARLMGPVDSSQPQHLPANSLGLKPAAPCVGLIAAPAVILVSDTKSLPALRAETSAEVATPQGPLPTSSPRMLLDKPRTPPHDAVCPGGAAPENLTAAVLKTMCTTTSGSESSGPLQSGPTLTTPTSSNSTIVTTTCTCTLNLKPAPMCLAKHIKWTIASTNTPASTAAASASRAPASTAPASSHQAPATTSRAPDGLSPGGGAGDNDLVTMFSAMCMTASGSKRKGPLPSGPILTTPISSSSTTVMTTSLKPAPVHLAKHIKWTTASTTTPASTAPVSMIQVPASSRPAPASTAPASSHRAPDGLSPGGGAGDNDSVTMFSAISTTVTTTSLKPAPVHLAKHIKWTTASTTTPVSTAPVSMIQASF